MNSKNNGRIPIYPPFTEISVILKALNGIAEIIPRFPRGLYFGKLEKTFLTLLTLKTCFS